jgi:hypothetical protein
MTPRTLGSGVASLAPSQDGVDCRIDEYEESPAKGLLRWCSRQVDEAEFVLIVCTES